MKITINGEAADITLENEKTVGELLAALEQFLEQNGHCLSGLSIDGGALDAESIPGLFSRDLDTADRIDITSSPFQSLLVQALDITIETLDRFCSAAGAERQALRDRWLSLPAASFLERRINELYPAITDCLSGAGLSPEQCKRLLAERRDELERPEEKLSGMAGDIETIASRLEELPLDLETGKDSRARETVQLFSMTSEKLLRIISYIYNSRNTEKTVDGTPIKVFLADFANAVEELSSAYGNKDAVLAGDLAEYELAPRFRALYGAFSGDNGEQ
jgi:hypothetical protein